MTATVSLAVHCPLTARPRLFSEGRTAVDPRHDSFEAADPGTSPVLNRLAVDLALRLALALNAEIAATCRWTRRRWPNASLPGGYQITQVNSPLARGGWISAAGQNWPLAQVHLAEDMGTSRDPGRAGGARIEIWFAPITVDAAPKVIAACLYALRVIVHRTRVARPGALCCVTRVSLAPSGIPCTLALDETYADPAKAVAAELRRQSSLADHGLPLVPANVGYDSLEDRTFVLHDAGPDEYVDLPAPDIPPICIDAEWIAKIRGEPAT